MAKDLLRSRVFDKIESTVLSTLEELMACLYPAKGWFDFNNSLLQRL
jgi:hypothetical protein